ncbi:protein PIN-LIKES 7-like [Ipomoea triloba]|uniref:protein PIN-LIKES 7-like n=1 Tax=Ipomoea triloba TaxID=35885 RepID=UPI00125E2665|nr:protein PIN-LIKES 7-like [Ipomoea triloba]
MGFFTLFEVASMPILQVLIISVLGAVMATDYFKLLPADARRSLNKIVFVAFTPSLIFANLAKTVTLEDIISWWFMPINIGLTFLFGGILGWIAVKVLKPKPHLEGLIIATCSSGNLGNLLLIIIPAICNEDGSPFGDKSVCSTIGMSYASFSMALGGFYIWTYTYQLVRNSSVKLKAQLAAEAAAEIVKEPSKDYNANEKSGLLENEALAVSVLPAGNDLENPNNGSVEKKEGGTFLSHFAGVLHSILEELMAPPTVGAILGFLFGAVTWLRNLIIGDSAPLRVIQDSVTLLGNGTIPCITLILGGNLTQGLRKAKISPLVILAVVCVRYILSPVVGICIVRAASNMGFLPADPLFHFVLMVQFTLPPAMNIGTMTQLFDVAQEECSVLFLWTYLVATIALTLWSTVFMWILS